MDKYKSLQVLYNNVLVGNLTQTSDDLTTFEYDPDWIQSGFSISPFSLPLTKKLFIPKFDPFYGLFGVFNDSLPDGWGRILVDRMLLKNNINPSNIDNLNRLAIIQNNGMGALNYQPEHSFDIQDRKIDLDKLSYKSLSIISNLDSDSNSNSINPDDLDELFKLGGSSGGARPKILTKIDGKDWIIKFLSSTDPKDSGLCEYRYSLCAKDCGINMSPTKLFDSKICSGYFGTQRFDRSDTDQRVHMVSVSGLLETSHRIFNLDYNLLMELTLKLTKSFDDVLQLYRLMCFNVFSHNRDDHSKNFSFIYNDTKKLWKLSPAYDLTYSSSLNDEHATTINGNGSSPDLKDILSVAKNIGIKELLARNIALEIKDKCFTLLNDKTSYI